MSAFTSTLWSVVLRARDFDGPVRREAFDKLCGQYGTPLYVYLLRKGLSREDARDAVQGFFVYFFEKELIERVDRSRGRFRSYLLAVLDRWLANERRLAAAKKRGGGTTTISLDFERADRELAVDSGDPPEGAYRRAWAFTVLRQAMLTLRREYESRGDAERFAAVCAHLSATGDRPSYAELATRLSCAESEVRNLIHSARARLRQHVRAALRETVETEAEVEEEIRELFA
jgi:RNA polymerase sigma-70 factor (ECF subfamily)